MPPHAALLTSALAVASLAAQQSELRQRIEAFSADLADLNRRYDTPMSTEVMPLAGPSMAVKMP